ncbi:hypothetical protein ETB97_010309 [Aspergillus alliaceus]|uniref:Uncharacterized protein n=1 Tax=Petromyces alliaceus TaxID=209559 RepID=A0A8H6E8H0_PETAA|nr:hypothetical protein ETB97_010309 [Aspergillus burnettii]
MVYTGSVENEKQGSLISHKGASQYMSHGALVKTWRSDLGHRNLTEHGWLERAYIRWKARDLKERGVMLSAVTHLMERAATAQVHQWPRSDGVSCPSKLHDPIVASVFKDGGDDSTTTDLLEQTLFFA